MREIARLWPCTVLVLIFGVVLAGAGRSNATGTPTVWQVTSETMTKGTSDGFNHENASDGIVNNKTEGGTSVPGNAMWAKPNSDSVRSWPYKKLYGPCGGAPHYCELNENPVNDGNNSYITSSTAGTLQWFNESYGLAIPAFPASMSSIESVQSWNWVRKNGTTIIPYYLRVFAVAGPTLKTCDNATITFSTNEDAFHNKTGNVRNDCAGIVWTDTLLSTVQVSPITTPGLLPNNQATLTSAGITVSFTTTTAEWLSFNSTFSGAQGNAPRLVYRCNANGDAATLKAMWSSVYTGSSLNCNNVEHTLSLSNFTGLATLGLYESDAGTGQVGVPNVWSFDELVLVTDNPSCLTGFSQYDFLTLATVILLVSVCVALAGIADPVFIAFGGIVLILYGLYLFTVAACGDPYLFIQLLSIGLGTAMAGFGVASLFTEGETA